MGDISREADEQFAGERLRTAMHRAMVEPRGTGMSMSSSGSHTTLRWRSQSRANSSLKPKFPVSLTWPIGGGGSDFGSSK